MERDEPRIIEAVLQGAADQFRVLVERYQKPIYSLMLRLTGSVPTAEDLTQDAFTQAYAKLHTFRQDRRFFPWLYTIAVNRARDHLRRRGIRQSLFEAEEPENPAADPDGHTCAARADCVTEVGRVAAAMERLPGGYREPLLMYYREGFTVKEIAGALRLSVTAVKVRIHRGRELLRQALGVHDETN